MIKPYIIGESVQGASHKRLALECQDSYKNMEFNDGTVILAVADGHGSKSCPYSKTGATIAVNVFCKVMTDLKSGFTDNTEMLLAYLNREGDTRIAQSIDAEWKRCVLKVHTNKKRNVPTAENGEKNKAEIYEAYGSTLVGIMITPAFLFAFQLGDGDITYVDSHGVDSVLQAEKILGVETHSLSKIDCWRSAVSFTRRRDSNIDVPSLFLLSTDGFSNSYKNEGEFKKTCQDYFDMIKEHGSATVAVNLKNWLDETSELGCGDDITVLMAYYDALGEQDKLETSVSSGFPEQR